MLKVLFSGTINPDEDIDNIAELIDAIEYTGVDFSPIQDDDSIRDFLSRVECELDTVLQEKNYALNFFWDREFYWEIGVATFTDGELEAIHNYMVTLSPAFSKSYVHYNDICSVHEKVNLALKESK